MVGMVLVLAGCYSYAPVSGPRSLDRGDAVRIHLADQLDVQLAEVTANDVVRLDGEVIGWRNDSLAMSAFLLVSETGYEHRSPGETVLVAEDRVAGLERRRIDRLRTGAFTIGLIALSSVTAVVLGAGGGEGDDPGGGPPMTQ